MKKLSLTAEWGLFLPQTPQDLICAAKSINGEKGSTDKKNIIGSSIQTIWFEGSHHIPVSDSFHLFRVLLMELLSPEGQNWNLRGSYPLKSAVLRHLPVYEKFWSNRN